MKDSMRGFLSIIFMFVIPFVGIVVPLTVVLGYFIDSVVISAIIATTVFFIFSRQAWAIILIFIASIIVPIIYGDFDLMVVSIVSVVIYLASPRILMAINKDE